MNFMEAVQQKYIDKDMKITNNRIEITFDADDNLILMDTYTNKQIEVHRAHFFQEWQIQKECKFCIQEREGVLEVSKGEGLYLCNKHKGTIKDNWNLADNKFELGKLNVPFDVFKEEIVKTFIQKVKEDIDFKGSIIEPKIRKMIIEIIDKRAGDLK